MTDETKVLSRADFLAASQNYKREFIPVPKLGGSVYINELSTGQKLEYNERIKNLEKQGETEIGPLTSLELMALLISMCASDANDNPLFSEADVKALTWNEPEVLLELSIKVMEVSGLGNAVIDEVAANLKNGQSDSSPSD